MSSNISDATASNTTLQLFSIALANTLETLHPGKGCIEFSNNLIKTSALFESLRDGDHEEAAALARNIAALLSNGKILARLEYPHTTNKTVNRKAS